MSWLSALVTRILPVVVSVVVVNDWCLTFVVVTVVVVSMFELIVVDFSETDVCGELCGASDVSIFSLSVLLSSEHHKQFVKLVNCHC